jgi:hypothetical protein
VSSPFPGMDPYLEDPAFWADFHYTFINYWREAIADVLPATYEANLGEKVYLVEYDPDSRKLIGPDVALSDRDASATTAPTQAAGLATLEPVTIPIAILDAARETYIEILHGPERTLVAVLERLSPTNKDVSGRAEYLAKRNAVLRQAVHLVELDLLVGGTRPPLRKPWPAGDYHYLISRSEFRPDAQVYSWTVRDPLPRVPTPLRSPDNDIAVDLAAVFTTAYERGRFGKRIRYGVPCPAPLSAAARTWAETLAGKS